MGHEIGHGHFTGEHKCREAREEAENDEDAANELKPASQAHERKSFDTVLEIVGEREFEILCGAMLKEEQAGDDAEGREKRAGPGCGDNSVKHLRDVSSCLLMGRLMAEVLSVTSRISYWWRKRYGKVFTWYGGCNQVKWIKPMAS
jgi:hypothetical protein